MKMSFVLPLLAVAGVLATAQTVLAQGRGPADTGSMAYPAPLPQGVRSTASVPVPSRPTDTGSMAFPAPTATGSSAPFTVR